jgi:hypothetical protein
MENGIVMIMQKKLNKEILKMVMNLIGEIVIKCALLN